MVKSRGLYWLSVAALATLCGLIGGFNYHWMHMAAFPAYGIILDLLAAPVVVGLVFHVRRMKKQTSDEFSVAKKRFAAGTGFAVGFVLFAISGIVPVFLPDLYHQFINSLDGANDGFIMGRVAGMAPFVIGLVVGQIASWIKYR